MNGSTKKETKYLDEHIDAAAIGRVYAEALIEQAAARQQEQEVLDELEALLRKVFDPHPELEEFLTGDALGRESKARVIDATFANRASDLVFNFLHVLNEHDRLVLIRPITYVYRQLLERKHNQMRVEVRSAVPLAPDQRERLRGELRQVFQREPLLDEAVDRGLLGGLVVRVGDWLYDASLRTRLDRLLHEVVEKGSHEIQSGRERFQVGG